MLISGVIGKAWRGVAGLMAVMRTGEYACLFGEEGGEESG